MYFGKIIYVYSENHKNHITTLSEQNGDFFNVEAGGKYSNNSVSMDYYYAL
jgi:hypothetical protein